MREVIVGMQDLKGRDLKQRVKELLESSEFSAALRELRSLPPRKVINPLFSFLYHTNEQLKWHAVTAMGIVVADLADKDMESARVIMRRLMWNLNDESGGIGWGSSEALGEILACHKGLATEYANILLSYIREDGNFQEHEMMQRGVLWGIARLVEKRPELLPHAVSHIMPFLSASDPAKRGLAVRIAGLLGCEGAKSKVLELTNDESGFTLYHDGALHHYTVKQMAEWALEKRTVLGA
ncbi:MAG TPA: HEAT repeat domain-containing protein [Desulfobacteraceae bacterium]|nr:HEAT repeat domain-containing protein [Desulfobacteraceae bacterium]